MSNKYSKVYNEFKGFRNSPRINDTMRKALEKDPVNKYIDEEEKKNIVIVTDDNKLIEKPIIYDIETEGYYEELELSRVDWAKIEQERLEEEQRRKSEVFENVKNLMNSRLFGIGIPYHNYVLYYIEEEKGTWSGISREEVPKFKPHPKQKEFIQGKEMQVPIEYKPSLYIRESGRFERITEIGIKVIGQDGIEIPLNIKTMKKENGKLLIEVE